MPIISQFYGIIVKMFFNDNLQHNLPHIHVEYAEHKAVFDLNSNMISGKIPTKQRKLVEAWVLFGINTVFNLLLIELNILIIISQINIFFNILIYETQIYSAFD